jgi:dTDP-4-amino-4,6-dideoxy-D-glucose transaminase
MMNNFAAFGATPRFAKPLHTAQINLPGWERMDEAFRTIFERRFFTNHGPKLTELDLAFAQFTGARHAISVTNGTVALMLMARGLGLTGEVIVPAFTFPATVQALVWAGLTPVLCDVDPKTHMLSAERVSRLIGERTSGVLGVHLWGRPCAPQALERLCHDKGLILFFDACHGLGCASEGRRFGNFGSAEAFSFHATKLINAAEGGCITTNDDEVAARLRTLRSFSPAHEFADVQPRMNGKMSEAQATMALLSLQDVDKNMSANRERHDAYRHGLKGLPGITVIDYSRQEINNHQYVVLEIEADRSPLSRDDLYKLLLAENVVCRYYFHAGMHQLPPLNLDPVTRARKFPETELLTTRLLQLPNSQSMSVEDVVGVCELMQDLFTHATEIRRRMP